MSRLAEVPSPWRYVLYALAAIVVVCVLRWVDREDPAQTALDNSDPTDEIVPLHVQLAPGVAPEALYGPRVHPLFHHVYATSLADPHARWLEFDVPARHVDATLAELLASPYVTTAFIRPTVALPSLDAPKGSDSCPITTPSFEPYQEYVGPAPKGVDAPAAWKLGIRGAGVQFADIEGAWNPAHEDLPGERITHAGGAFRREPSWRAHGTAVLGEVVARDNGKGVVGLAPDVDHIYTSSIGDTSVADALDAAGEHLRAGDVLLIELQGAGPRGRYLPMEYWDDNFEVIQELTARGIVVIEAAGNGAEDLDHLRYRGKLSRSGRDSGAIMVGAGGPPRAGYTDRARLDFSNYGTRVDVQGWGRKVATLDYGDLQDCSDDFHRHYTGEFSGTSSASPIVAGAAVLVESYARAHGGPLAPRAVRELLTATGTAQAGELGEHIGPRPDLARALAALQR